MIYEYDTEKEQYSFVIYSLEIAMIVSIIVNGGFAELNTFENKNSIPKLAKINYDDWCKVKLDNSFKNVYMDVYANNKKEIGEALGSVCLCGLKERAGLEKTIEAMGENEKNEYRREWNSNRKGDQSFFYRTVLNLADQYKKFNEVSGVV